MNKLLRNAGFINRNSTHIMNIIASNLLAKREERRYTQAYMALQSNMSQPNYSDIERGKTTPSIAQLKIFASVLNTTVDELIQEKGGQNLKNFSPDFREKTTSPMTPAEMHTYIRILENQLRNLLERKI